MADFEKVYRIGFDASKAQRTLTRFQKKIEVFEKKAKNVGKQVAKFLGPEIAKGTDKAGKGVERLGRKGKMAMDKLRHGARGAEGGIKRVGTAARATSVSLTGLITKIAAFIAVARGIRSLRDEYLGWDEQMTRAGAKLGAMDAAMKPGTKTFKAYRKEILAVTKDTEHLESAIGGAVNFWAKAGKSAEQAKAVIPITLDFASANEDAAGAALQAARAGDILSDALGQFRLDSKNPIKMMRNTARIADVMSKAANSANFSAEELFESYKQAGPVLTSVGSDIEETSALLAVMANAGIKGAMSGTQLKVAITALSAPAGGARALMESLGVKIKDANGDFRGLTTIIGELNEATKEMGTGERFEVFAKLIGRRAIPSFINLLAKGQDELDGMTAKLREASGETSRLAGEIRGSASKQIDAFYKKLRTLGFQILDETRFFDRLKRAMDGVDWKAAADFINKEVVPAFLWMGDVIKNIIWPAIKETVRILKDTLGPILDTVTSMLKGLGGEGSSLGKTLGKLIAVWIKYKLAMFAILGPLGKLTGGIGGLSTKIGLASTAQLGLNTALAGGVRGFGALASAINPVITALLGGVAAGQLLWETVLKDIDEDFYKKKIREDITKMQYKEIEKDPEKWAPDVRMKAAKAKQQELREKWGPAYDVESLSEFKKAKSIEQQAQQEIYMRGSRANIAKYGGPTGRGMATGQTRLPEMYTEWQDDWAMMSQAQPIEVRVIPDPKSMDDFEQSVEDWGQQMSVPVEGDFKHPVAFFQKRSRLPEDDFGAGANTGWQSEMIDLQSKAGAEQRIYHEKMLAANTKAAPKPIVNQNFQIEGAKITINSKGGDPKEIASLVRKGIQDHERIQAAGLKQMGREVAPSEF